ncbi:MAG: sulfotransferase [Acetobacteraceae bacterium]
MLAQRADQLLKAGRPLDAISALEQAVRLHGDDATLHHRLGSVLLGARRIEAADAAFRQALTLDPKLAAAHHGLGIALQLQGRAEPAIAAHRRAIALAPGLADGHNRLGDLLHSVGDTAGAAEAFQRVYAVSPNTTGGRLARAKALIIANSPEQAEVALRRAVALDPTSAEAARLFGTLLATAGRFHEAAAQLERSLAIDPTQVSPFHDLMHCRRLSEADRPLVERMRARLGGKVTVRQRMLLHFALGKALDDLADYPAAMQHFDAANRIRGDLVGFDRAGLVRLIDAIITRFTPDFMARHADPGLSDATPILVIGMPRSGTTLIEQILSSHHDVGGAGELGVWGARGSAWMEGGEGALAGEHMRGIAQDYLDVLARAAPGKARVIDKMPYNFLWVGLIRLVLPRATFLHCRRDPVDTCLSIYFTHFAQRTEFAARREDLVFYYRQYERLMAHWRLVLPPGRLIDVEYATLIADREVTTRHLLASCGLQWDEACLYPERNRRIVRTATVWQARQPVYTRSVERWRNYENWLGALRELFVPL